MPVIYRTHGASRLSKYDNGNNNNTNNKFSNFFFRNLKSFSMLHCQLPYPVICLVQFVSQDCDMTHAVT